MAESIDISGLDGYFREYKETIFTQNLIPSECEQHMDVIEDVRDELILPTLTIGNVVKGWESTFSPANNTIVMSQRTLKVRPLTIEATWNPQLLRKEWIAKLQKNGFSEADLPLERFIIEKLLQKGKEELELLAIALGISTWPTKPTSASGAYNGFLKIIADEILASSITPVVTGAITIANAIESVESVFQASNGRLQTTESKMFMSYGVYNLYLMQYRDQWGANVNNKEFKKTYLDLSNGLCELVPLRAWGSSQRLLHTVQENMKIGIDAQSDFATVKAQTSHRNIDVWADFQQSVQINTVSDDVMTVNDRT